MICALFNGQLCMQKIAGFIFAFYEQPEINKIKKEAV
jgi:hypothetical protein